jgi:hypothetical protein
LPWSRNLFRLRAYDGSNAQLKVLNGFDWALFIHSSPWGSLKLNPNDRARYLKGMDKALEKEALGICPNLNPSGKSKRVLGAFTPWGRQQNGNGLNARGYSTVLQTATLPLGYPTFCARNERNVRAERVNATG